MMQTISMLDFRKKAGQVIDETLYLKKRWLITRKNKPVAMLSPKIDEEEVKKQSTLKKKRVGNVLDMETMSKEEMLKAWKPMPKKPYFLKLIGALKNGPPDMSVNKRKYL